MEPADGISRNSLLHSHGVETFFVTSRNTPVDSFREDNKGSIDEDLLSTKSSITSSESVSINEGNYISEINSSKQSKL